MAGQARQWGIDIHWKDVTESFRTSAQTIPSGELIKTGWFSLQEAVAAIEVMDPKLDTGVATEEELRDPFLSVDSRFERGLVPVDGFSGAELAGVMDDLTAAEMSYLAGGPLTQTIGVSLHVLRPDRVVDARLRAFCMSVSRCGQHFANMAHEAAVFREEDFCPDSPHVLTDVERPSLEELAATLEELARAAKADAAALSLRLDARARWTRLCQQLFVPAEERTRESVDAILASARALSAMLAELRSSSAEAAEGAARIGFDPRVTVKLTSHAFTRHVPAWKRKQGFDYMERFLGELTSVGALLAARSISELLHGLLLLSEARPTIGALPRSFAHLWLLPKHAVVLLADATPSLVLADMARLSRPPWAPAIAAALAAGAESLGGDVCASAREPLDFVHSLAQPLSTLAQVVSHLLLNRARLHRRLVDVLAELDALQGAAAEVDDASLAAVAAPARPSTFTSHAQSWAYHIKLRLMCEWLLLHFELELFVPDDMPVALWYLDYLLGCDLQNRAAMDEHRAAVAASAALEGASNRKKKQAMRGGAASAAALAPPRPLPEADMLGALQCLVRGVLRFMLALRYAGTNLQAPAASLADADVIFARRFAPLLATRSPQPLSLALFRTSFPAGRSERAKDMLAAAADSLQQAKARYERLLKGEDADSAELARSAPAHHREWLTLLLKTTIANAVNVRLAEQALQSTAAGQAERKVSIELPFSKQIPVVRLIT